MSKRDDPLVADALSKMPSGGRVLGVIFAGGVSRRFGHDKALVELDGIPLLHWVADRFGPQVDALAVAGQSRPGISIPTIPDQLPGEGPLAALCSVLSQAAHRGWTRAATIPCDTPFIPKDIVARLSMALQDRDCAVANWMGGSHPTCALWSTGAHAKLESMFDSGVRSLRDAITHSNASEVDFSDNRAGPGGDPFFNINSPSDLIAAQTWLAEGRDPA
jgi:molybdopterin-guanine dinucleotide biosynthesis protein A